MQSIHSKIVILLLVLAVISSGLVGCAPKATPAPAAVPPTSTPAPTEPPKKPYEGKTLTMVYLDANYADAAEAIIPEFEEMTGCKVELIRQPWATMHEKYVTALVGGGGGYDMMHQVYRTELELADYYEDLGPYIEKDPDFNLDEFLPNIVAMAGHKEGRRHGIPMSFAPNAITYRTDLFEEAGITPNPEWTWDEYMDTVEKLTTDAVAGVTISLIREQIFQVWLVRYWGLGGHLFTNDWKPLPQKDLAIQATQMLKDMLPYAPDGALSYAIPEWQSSFLQGGAAMAEGWTTFLWSMAEDPDQSKIVGQWDVLPFPGPTAQIAGPWSFSIPESAKEKDLAWEWIKFATSAEKQQKALFENGVIPTRTDVFESPEVVEKMPWFPNFLYAVRGGRPLPRIATANEILEAINDKVGAVLAGDLTPEQAVDQLITIWEQAVEAAAPTGQYTDDYLD